MNHAPAILAVPALIYSTHRLLVVWIIVVHFHLYSLLCRYTALEVWAVWRPMRVCCGSRQGRCVLFTNILDSLTAPCLVYNTAMYTVYGRCGQYGWCMLIHWPVRPVCGLYGPVRTTHRPHQPVYEPFGVDYNMPGQTPGQFGSAMRRMQREMMGHVIKWQLGFTTNLVISFQNSIKGDVSQKWL